MNHTTVPLMAPQLEAFGDDAMVVLIHYKYHSLIQHQKNKH